MGKENAMKFFRITLCTLLLALTGCFDGYGPDGIDPGPDPIYKGDYELNQCFKRYVWTGLWWQWECPNDNWFPVSNEPIFTSLSDCHNALHRVAMNPNYWDPHNDAKKDNLRASGSAYFLWCFEV